MFPNVNASDTEPYRKAMSKLEKRKAAEMKENESEQDKISKDEIVFRIR